MTTTDPFASLASTAFRAWAVLAQSAMQSGQALLRMLAESTFAESPVDIVGGSPIEIDAPAGTPLTATQFAWEDEDTGEVTTDLRPEHVIGPQEVSIVPSAVPEHAPGTPAVVLVQLHPNHPVRTGNFDGTVRAGSVEVEAVVYVHGIDL